MWKKHQASETLRNQIHNPNNQKSSQPTQSPVPVPPVSPDPRTKTSKEIKTKEKKKTSIADPTYFDGSPRDEYFLKTLEKVYEGQTVLTEDSLITFPRFDNFHNDRTLCCGCCEFITSPKARCSTCGLPLCGPECKQISAHTDYECKIFTLRFLSQTMDEIWKNKKLRTRVYLLVAIFRCLSVKLMNSYKWSLFEELMKLPSTIEKATCLSSLEDLGNIGEVFLAAKQVVDAIQHGEYPELQNPPDHEQMVKVADMVVSIASVLTKFGLSSWPENLHNGMMSLLYTTGRISHDCNPNTTGVMTGNGAIKLVAAHALKEGTRITIGRHLSQSVWFLQGFHYRQPLLNSQFLTHEFCSNCSNCSDNNSGISVVKCSSCNSAFMMPVVESRWQCVHVECSHVSSETEIRLKILEGTDVVKKYSMIRNGLRDVDKLVRDINSMENTLSTSHFIVLALKMEYLKLVRQYRLKDDEFLERVLIYGQQILTVLNSIMKGISYFKGLLCFYMHFAHEILLERAMKIPNSAEMVNYHRHEMLVCIMESKKNWSWRKNFTTLQEEQEFHSLVEAHWQNDFCMFVV